MKYNDKENLLESNRESIEKNAFANHNGVNITYIKLDYAEGKIDLTADSMNAYNVVHGGAYFVLADVTAGFAARSNGKKYVTEQCSMNFIKGVTGGTIYCKSQVINRGKSVCIIESKIYDDDARLVYSGTFNYFCID